MVTARYTAGFHEILFHDPAFPDGKKEHWVDGTWFFDAQATYDFNGANPLGSASPASLVTPGWKNWLTNTSITIGCNNVFGQDPPKAYGNSFSNPFGYPAAIYDPTGRFVYITLKMKF